MSSSKFIHRLKSLIFISSTATTATFGYLYYKNDETAFKKFFMPTLRMLDAERAHELGILMCKWKILPKVDFKDPESLVR
jgi:hypothetical protein